MLISKFKLNILAEIRSPKHLILKYSKCFVMVSITCYGGVSEIGGNKILIEDKDSKIFFDFGMSFGKRAMFFEEYLKPRASNGIVDLIFTGLLPEIKGVYRKDLLKFAGMEVHEYPSIDAVFLTHPHADHANYISFLDDEIPIYLGECALSVLRGVQEPAVRDIEKEIVNYKKRPLMKKDYKNPPVEREFRTFRSGNKIKINDIEVIPIHVDHSVPGSYGFLIHCSDATIVYTGDIRMHGLRADMSREFIEKAAYEKPDALITEGTRIGQNIDKTEFDVRKDCEKFISNSTGLTVADFNFKDVDRLKTFFGIAKDSGKKLVIQTKDAIMLKHLSKDPKLKLPTIDNERIAIYMQKSASGTYSEEDYMVHEKELFANSGITILKGKDIAQKENDYVFVGGFFSMNDLIDIRPKKSTYIYSHSEPFNEDMEMDFARLHNWIKLYEMDYKTSHCSGHANWNDIISMINEINAKTIIPVHTEKPEEFRFNNVKNPEFGRTINL